MGRSTGTTQSKVRVKQGAFYNKWKENGRNATKTTEGERQEEVEAWDNCIQLVGFGRAMHPRAMRTRLFRLIYPISLPIFI
jgi:hypothetical protein